MASAAALARLTQRLGKGAANARTVEVLEETRDLAPGDMDDEADRGGDEISGFEPSMENMALDEPALKELACEHLIPKLGDSPSEVSEERQILFTCLRSTRDVVPDLGLGRIELADPLQVAALDRSKELRRDRVGLFGHR